MTNHAHVSRYVPEPYKGKVRLSDGSEMTIIEIATMHEMAPIFFRAGDWVVTSGGVECLTQSYEIALHCIDEQDWPEHMRAKVWVNHDDFASALYAAKQLVKLGVIHPLKEPIAAPIGELNESDDVTILGPYLQKATVDPFEYMAFLKTGLRIFFQEAIHVADADWVILNGEKIGEHLGCPCPRGIQVRLSDIILVADAPNDS